MVAYESDALSHWAIVSDVYSANGCRLAHCSHITHAKSKCCFIFLCRVPFNHRLLNRSECSQRVTRGLDGLCLQGQSCLPFSPAHDNDRDFLVRSVQTTTSPNSPLSHSITTKHTTISISISVSQTKPSLLTLPQSIHLRITTRTPRLQYHRDHCLGATHSLGAHWTNNVTSLVTSTAAKHCRPLGSRQTASPLLPLPHDGRIKQPKHPEWGPRHRCE